MAWMRKNMDRKRQSAKRAKDVCFFGGNKKAVLKRDKNRCRMCGAKKGLCVHHIDGNGSQVPKKKRNNNTENLVVLCRSCHLKVHRNEIDASYLVPNHST